jgi:hypothetical protein
VITYYVLLLADTIWPGFVSNNIDFTTMLWLVLGSGVVASLLPPSSSPINQTTENISSGQSVKTNVWLPLISGLLVMLILAWMTKPIGHSAIIVAVAGGLITALLSKLLLSQKSSI